MTQQQNPFSQGFFDELIGQNPRETFFSFQNQRPRSPNQRTFFQNQFQEAQDRFSGLLFGQIRAGQAPTARFQDFLGGQNFNQNFLNQTPSQRGFSSGGFAPPTRFFT